MFPAKFQELITYFIAIRYIDLTTCLFTHMKQNKQDPRSSCCGSCVTSENSLCSDLAHLFDVCMCVFERERESASVFQRATNSEISHFKFIVIST